MKILHLLTLSAHHFGMTDDAPAASTVTVNVNVPDQHEGLIKRIENLLKQEEQTVADNLHAMVAQLEEWMGKNKPAPAPVATADTPAPTVQTGSVPPATDGQPADTPVHAEGNAGQATGDQQHVDAPATEGNATPGAASEEDSSTPATSGEADTGDHTDDPQPIEQQRDANA